MLSRFMSLTAKMKESVRVKKSSDERGALMLEAIALLGLMTLMSPMLVKQTSEKTQEVEEVAVAGQMKMLRDAALSYVDANLGSLGDTTASGMFGEGYSDADGAKQAIVLNNSDLAAFLPPGFCLEEEGECIFQNRLAENYRAAILRQHSCDTRDADGQRTDECRPFDYTVLIVSGPRKDGEEAQEIADRRAMRIASMIGADGGFIPSESMAAAVTGNSAQVSVIGAQGIWEIPDVSEFFSANSAWRPGRGQVAVTTVYKGNSSLGEFLYRKPTSVEGGNAMFTDLDMAGQMGVPNNDDGRVTDPVYGVGAPHDIKGARGLFMSSDGGLYVRALPRNTTVPGTARFNSYNSAQKAALMPQAQFTRATMSTGDYAEDEDGYVTEHRIRHNLNDSGAENPGKTTIAHKEHADGANFFYYAPGGGFRYMPAGTHMQSSTDMEVAAPTFSYFDRATIRKIAGISFNSSLAVGNSANEFAMRADSSFQMNGSKGTYIQDETILQDFGNQTALVGQIPSTRLESRITNKERVREVYRNAVLELEPGRAAQYTQMSEDGTMQNETSWGRTPSFSLYGESFLGYITSINNVIATYPGHYKAGLFSRPYSMFADELMDIPYQDLNSSSLFRAGNGKDDPSLSLTREQTFTIGSNEHVRATGLDMRGGAGNFDAVSLYSDYIVAAGDAFSRSRSYITLDEMPVSDYSTNSRVTFNDVRGARIQTYGAPIRYRIGAEKSSIGSTYKDFVTFSGLEGIVGNDSDTAAMYGNSGMTSADSTALMQDMSSGGRLGTGEISTYPYGNGARKEYYKSVNDYFTPNSVNMWSGFSFNFPYFSFSGVEYKKSDRRFKPLVSANSADYEGAPSSASLVSSKLGTGSDTKSFISTMTGDFTTYGEEIVDYEPYMSSNGYYYMHRKFDVAADDITAMNSGIKRMRLNSGYGRGQSRIAMGTKDVYDIKVASSGFSAPFIATTSLNMEPIVYGANSMLAPSSRMGAKLLKQPSWFGVSNHEVTAESTADLKMYAYENNPKASLFTQKGSVFSNADFVEGNSFGGYGRERDFRMMTNGGLQVETRVYDRASYNSAYSQVNGRDVYAASVNSSLGSNAWDNRAYETRTRLSASFEENGVETKTAGYYSENGEYVTPAYDTSDMSPATENWNAGVAQLDLTSNLNLLRDTGLSSVPINQVKNIYSSFQNPISPNSPQATLSVISTDETIVKNIQGAHYLGSATLTRAAELKLRSHSFSKVPSANSSADGDTYSLSFIPSLNLAAAAVWDQPKHSSTYRTIHGSSLAMDAFSANSNNTNQQLRSILKTEKTSLPDGYSFRNAERFADGQLATSEYGSFSSRYLTEDTERGSLEMTAGTGEYSANQVSSNGAKQAVVALSSVSEYFPYAAGSDRFKYSSRVSLSMNSYLGPYHAYPVSQVALNAYSHSGSSPENAQMHGVLSMAVRDNASEADFLLHIDEADDFLGASRTAGFSTAFGRSKDNFGDDNEEYADYFGLYTPPSANVASYAWGVSSAIVSTSAPTIVSYNQTTAPNRSANSWTFFNPVVHNKVQGGLAVSSVFGSSNSNVGPVVAAITSMQKLNMGKSAEDYEASNNAAVYGRLVLMSSTGTSSSAQIDLDTRYWKIKDGYIEAQYADPALAELPYYSFEYDASGNAVGRHFYGPLGKGMSQIQDSLSVSDTLGYMPSTGYGPLSGSTTPKSTISSMFKDASGKYRDIYGKFRLDPAYVSVMNDIKLTSRGGANLSDILPNYILKSIYTLTNQYAKGPWPCQTDDFTTRIMEKPDAWKKSYDYGNSNPGNCSFVIPKGRLAKFEATEKPGNNGLTHIMSRNSYYMEAWQNDCSLMNRFGYKNYCTAFAMNLPKNLNPRSLFVSYAANDYYHCAGGASTGCLTHPFMGLVPAPGMKIGISAIGEGNNFFDVTVDDRDAGVCPAGYLPVMTVTPTAFDVGKVIFIDAGSQATASTIPTDSDKPPGIKAFVNDLSKLPITEEDDELNTSGGNWGETWLTNPNEPSTYAWDVFQLSRRFANFGHQDYRTEVPFIYQPATRVAVAAKPLCAANPGHCAGQAYMSILRGRNPSMDCGGKDGYDVLCGWAVAMGTVTPNNVKTSNNSPEYFWNMGGIFAGSMQALVHTYCYFNQQNFIYPNAIFDKEQRRMRPLDNPNLMK